MRQGYLQPLPDVPMKKQNFLPGIALQERIALGSPPDAPHPHVQGTTTEASPTQEATGDGWPPMSEMLHSLFVFEPSMPSLQPITVLGLDCGSSWQLASLPPDQRTLLKDAHVICGGQALLDALLSSPTQDEEANPITARLLPLTLPLEPLLNRLSQLRASGKRVLLLADGDPLFFGIGASLARQLGEDAVRLIPAVSSLQAACARLALPWHSVICLSLHGHDDLAPLNAAVGKGRPLCILCDAHTSPDVLARHLLDRGVDWFKAHIFERMGAADEARHDLSLAETASASFGPACTMLLLPADAPRRPCLGLHTAELAEEDALINKLPVRAAALSLLRVGPRHLVWDIGSGSGAVALEAAALAHNGRVFAVERSAGRAMSIQENRRRFGAATVEVCLGQAPDCLPTLPDPQRVFIGGGLSGEDGADIIGHVCHRLPPGGRLVAACVLLESLSQCHRYLEGLGWPVEIMQIQAAEGQARNSGIHLAAQDPVFLLAAEKPAGA